MNLDANMASQTSTPAPTTPVQIPAATLVPRVVGWLEAKSRDGPLTAGDASSLVKFLDKQFVRVLVPLTSPYSLFG